MLKRWLFLLISTGLIPAVSAQSLDLEVVDFLHNATPVTSLNLGANDDFNVSVVFRNNGPASIPNTMDKIYVDFLIDDQEYFSSEVLCSMLCAFYPSSLINTSITVPTPFTITAQAMHDEGLEGNFEVCVALRVNSPLNDPDLTNNKKCLTVNKTPLAIREQQDSKWCVFPNPSTDVLRINPKGSMIQSIEISDISGRIILKQETLNTGEVQLDISNLKSGVYFVNIQSEGKRFVEKILKQ